ncbi:hypothetical protein BOX15_Mlig000367g1 [Macrostomum lignano]|uniref:One cut domain family member n=1 Tax=Macrostomum lignano TaxID=282301 RepID=A0A267GTS4_9PLAT|nr:hypothetical protein BOX15_Mlig000367g1 [Macrostomum lignano]
MRAMEVQAQPVTALLSNGNVQMSSQPLAMSLPELIAANPTVASQLPVSQSQSQNITLTHEQLTQLIQQAICLPKVDGSADNPTVTITLINVDPNQLGAGPLLLAAPSLPMQQQPENLIVTSSAATQIPQASSINSSGIALPINLPDSSMLDSSTSYRSDSYALSGSHISPTYGSIGANYTTIGSLSSLPTIATTTDKFCNPTIAHASSGYTISQQPNNANYGLQVQDIKPFTNHNPLLNGLELKQGSYNATANEFNKYNQVLAPLNLQATLPIGQTILQTQGQGQTTSFMQPNSFQPQQQVTQSQTSQILTNSYFIQSESSASELKPSVKTEFIASSSAATSASRQPAPLPVLGTASSLVGSVDAQQQQHSPSADLPATSDGEEINTKELAHRISSELKRYSIPQAVFAQRVLCRSQGTLSDLLRNPKPWSKLKSGRETFRRMWKWLQEPELQRMSALRLAEAFHSKEDSVASDKVSPARAAGVACKRKEEPDGLSDLSLSSTSVADSAAVSGTPAAAAASSLLLTADCAGRSPPKKPRLVFTDIQRRTLHAIFKETKRPSKEMQATIAQQLCLEVSTVANFFMNARRRSLEKWQEDDKINVGCRPSGVDVDEDSVGAGAACGVDGCLLPPGSDSLFDDRQSEVASNDPLAENDDNSANSAVGLDAAAAAVGGSPESGSSLLTAGHLLQASMLMQPTHSTLPGL